MALPFMLRMLVEPDKRALWKFMWDFGWKGKQAVERFEKRLKKGKFFPAFLFISITDQCNLTCQGCWVTPQSPRRELSMNDLDRIISECKKQGAFFFGILGGEPLLHKEILEVFAKHPDAYFLLFSNGTLITDEIAASLCKLGNVSPLISIEGMEVVSDERRGGDDVFSRSMTGIKHCRRHRLVTGVATSVCKSNFNELVSEKFIDYLAERGVLYLWYYIYRPVGPNPKPELALDATQIASLRKFIVESRTFRSPLAIIDAYWDHNGKALCPAAVGIAHHIGPGGDIEPCPPLQFACDNIHDERSLAEIFSASKYLQNFRAFASGTTPGCVIMEAPGKLQEFVLANQARDTSGRNCGCDELTAMQPHLSHHLPGQEQPEKNGAYRFAKRKWFFGFGAYG